MALVKWAGGETNDFQECAATSGTFAIERNIVKSGIAAYRINPTTTGNGFLGLELTSATTKYGKFDFYVTTLPSADNE
jgi:hypothetical protein